MGGYLLLTEDWTMGFSSIFLVERLPYLCPWAELTGESASDARRFSSSLSYSFTTVPDFFFYTVGDASFTGKLSKLPV